jgi:hypothetical protein
MMLCASCLLKLSQIRTLSDDEAFADVLKKHAASGLEGSLKETASDQGELRTPAEGSITPAVWRPGKRAAAHQS